MPHAATSTKTSSAWMSGSAMSSRTSGWRYARNRAAFMCFAFPQSSGFADGRRGCLCHRDILFDRPRARADRSNDRAADQDRQTAAEDHDLATIALLDAEKRRAWLSHSCEVRGSLVEKPRRDRLTDGKVYAAD